MSFTLKMSGVIVGRSELENRDATGSRATGVFRPGLGYDLVQPIFDLYESAGDSAEALSRYRKSRDALHLELIDSSGNAVALRELRMLNQARKLSDLRIPPGNHLERLSGGRSGQRSIRINDQWRICFEWAEGGPGNVEIVDYH